MVKCPFTYTTRARFSQTDAAGVVHFTEILKWAEDAEHACLEEKAIAVMPVDGGGWPRVNVNCDYLAPVRYGDVIEVRLGIAELGKRSIDWSFEVWSGECLAARGQMVTVKLGADGRAVELSDDERAALELIR